MPSVIDRIAAPLYVPATSPERFPKAINSCADAVIIDLEDAVAASMKDSAREVLRRELPVLMAAQGNLPGNKTAVGIRINSAATDLMDEDVRLLASIRQYLDFVVLPEVQSADDLVKLRDLLEPSEIPSPLPVVALIESSLGLLNAAAIAEFPSVRRLGLGAADLSKEWEVEPSPEETEFDFARQMLVVASRAARLVGPLDNPHMNVQDTEGLTRRVYAIAGLGMKGKQCIHPKQTETVLRTFLISTEEHARLTSIVKAFEEAEKRGVSSIQMHGGDFVDYPVYYRAKKQIAIYDEKHGA